MFVIYNFVFICYFLAIFHLFNTSFLHFSVFSNNMKNLIKEFNDLVNKRSKKGVGEVKGKVTVGNMMGCRLKRTNLSISLELNKM